MNYKLSRYICSLSVISCLAHAEPVLEPKGVGLELSKAATIEETMALIGEFEASAIVVHPEPLTTRYMCSLKGKQRKVEIQYSSEDTPLPCYVNYTKKTELPGVVKTLWSASLEEGYCERKASAFLEKQEAWGWNCQEI